MEYYTIKRPWIEIVEELKEEQGTVTYEEIKKIQDTCDGITNRLSDVVQETME